MTTPTPARATPPEAPQSEGGAGFLATKLGPLPLWAWGAAGLAILLYVRMRGNNAAATTAASTVSSSQIPEFINQTYTTVTPPVADPGVDSTGKPDPQPTPGSPPGTTPPGTTPPGTTPPGTTPPGTTPPGIKPPVKKPGPVPQPPADMAHMALVNKMRVLHKMLPYSVTQYQGVYGNAAQKANVLAHTPSIDSVNLNRKMHSATLLTTAQYRASYLPPYNGGLWAG